MEEVEINTRERGKEDAGRCTNQVSKRAYPKKRRAHKGGGLKKVGDTNLVKQSAVASKKVKRIKTPRERNLQGFRLFDITTFLPLKIGQIFTPS